MALTNHPHRSFVAYLITGPIHGLSYISKGPNVLFVCHEPDVVEKEVEKSYLVGSFR